MPPRFTITGVGLILLVVFLLALTVVLLWIGRIGPIPPTPQVLVSVNDEEPYPIKPLDNVKVKKGEIVRITVQEYYQGQPINPGEFTYQWCFEPAVNDNRYCSVTDYRSNTNSDYKPENSAKQELEIIINHDIFKTLTVPISFTPE